MDMFSALPPALLRSLSSLVSRRRGDPRRGGHDIRQAGHFELNEDAKCVACGRDAGDGSGIVIGEDAFDAAEETRMTRSMMCVGPRPVGPTWSGTPARTGAMSQDGDARHFASGLLVVFSHKPRAVCPSCSYHAWSVVVGFVMRLHMRYDRAYQLSVWERQKKKAETLAEPVATSPSPLRVDPCRAGPARRPPYTAHPRRRRPDRREWGARGRAIMTHVAPEPAPVLRLAARLWVESGGVVPASEGALRLELDDLEPRVRNPVEDALARAGFDAFVEAVRVRLLEVST